MYPGAGYSWVSPYPWGWLPYHSGTWSFFPGYGWGWQPGGAFNGLNNITTAGGGMGTTATMAGGTVRSPLRSASLPQPPVAGTARQSMVLSNQKPMVFSQQDKSGNFVFQKDSAGLGVPRGSLGNLNHISNEVGRHGFATMEVHASGPEEGGRAGRGPVTLRPGSPAEGSMGERGNSSTTSSASRAGSPGGSQGSQGAQSSAPPYHGGGGAQPMGGGAPMGAPAGSSGAAASSGGGRGAASPK
jgi:hypothetical protein